MTTKTKRDIQASLLTVASIAAFILMMCVEQVMIAVAVGIVSLVVMAGLLVCVIVPWTMFRKMLDK